MASTRTRKPATRKPAVKASKPASKPVEKVVKTPSNCGCGCGQPAITSKAAFLPGHDARHAGNLGRALAASPQDKSLLAQRDLLSEPLRRKVDGITATAVRRQAVKDAAKVAKAAAEAAYADALKAAGIPA